MDGFAAWLRETKQYSDRSISDVYSRLNRAAKICPREKFDKYYIADLEDEPDFMKLSTSVRSQIKKAIQLKIAYIQTVESNG